MNKCLQLSHCLVALFLALFCGVQTTIAAIDYSNLSLDDFNQMTSSTTDPAGDNYFRAIVSTTFTGPDTYCYYVFENFDGSLNWRFTPRCAGSFAMGFLNGSQYTNCSNTLFTNTTIGETVIDPNLNGVAVTYSNIGWIIEFPIAVHCVLRQQYASYATVYWGNLPFDTSEIMVEVSPEGSGTITGEGTYERYSICTLEAVANEGYAFLNWTINDGVVSTNTPYSFTVYGDRVIMANFASTNPIVFSDANVKDLCLTNWDIDDDGELSYYEAAVVTNLDNVFRNNTTIHSFNELQYFISLDAIDEQAFYGCTGLTQVTIPENVAFVGNKAFWNCPALQTVTFNAINCTSMQTSSNSNNYSVFSSNDSGGPSSLTRVVVGNKVQRIPDYAFKDAVDIYQRLVIPASVTSIGNYAFYNCNSLVQMAIQGNNLLNIGDYAFYGCSALRSALNLPNSVTTVGQYAFYGCLVLPSLTIGEGVNTIGGHAFYNCPALATVHFNATNCAQMDTYSYSVFNSSTNYGGTTPIVTLTIGENVTRIPDCAFRNSSNMTSSIIIPNVTTYIGRYAFFGSASTEVFIGENVTTIAKRAFWTCPNLATVHFNASNCTSMQSLYNGSIYYSVFDNGNGDGTTPIVNLTIGDNVTYIPDHSFQNSPNLIGNLIIPNGVTYIGSSSFDGCSGLVGNLIIPDAVTFIGPCAFRNCSGFNGVLSLSSSLSQIHDETFCGCSALIGALRIPNSVTSIGTSAFRDCGSFTGELLIHDELTTINDHAFFGCSNISSLIIGEAVAYIGGFAFWDCLSLATVYFNAINCTQMFSRIGNQYHYYDYSVFNRTSGQGESTPIVTLIIGDKVTQIPDYAFYNSASVINDLIIPNSTTTIGRYAFANSYRGEGCLAKLRIGDSVNTIGEYAFSGCNGFRGDLVIPNSVTLLSQYAFQNCSGFNGSLVIGSGMQTINSSTFAGCFGFVGSLIVGRQVNSIGNYAFQNCNGFTVLISENPTPPSALNSSFQGMNFSIPLYVPYAMMPAYQGASGWSQFTNRIEQCVFDHLDNDNWSDEWNWYAFELPGPNDVVCVNSNCHLDLDVNVLHLYVYNLNDVFTINSGMTLTATYGIGTLQASQLVVADGGQLANPFSNAYGTMQKQINGYGSNDGSWYAIASPIYGGTDINTFATGNYDLYAYDESTATWLNQKEEGSFDMLNLAQGYLYASQSPKTLNFAGQLIANNTEISIPISCTNGGLAGFNLVGNPFSCNAYINRDYYVMNEDGTGINPIAVSASTPIPPCTGVFVKAEGEGETVIFIRAVP